LRFSGTITAAFVRHLVVTAGGLGLDTDELLRGTRLSPAQLDDPDERIPIAVHDRMWDFIAANAGAERFARAAADRFQPQCFGVAGLLATSSDTIGDMGDVLDRYGDLIGPPYLPPRVVSRDGRSSEFVFRFPPGILRLRERGDIGAINVLRTLRLLTGTSFRPLEVRFQHARPPDPRLYDEWFDCPVRFNSPETSVVLPLSTSQPLLRGDSGIQGYLARHANVLLERLTGTAPFSARVHECLCAGLRSGRSTALATGRLLGVSERSMQRYLRSEGTSFEEILERTRRELAMIYLDDPTLGIAEIAQLLGYSEASVFFRAFRRWTGITPARYRRTTRRALDRDADAPGAKSQ
jgi:AraC-like DNA-binding protein